MDRRNFLSAMPGLYPATLLAAPVFHPARHLQPGTGELDRIPNFCTHEHWGSVDTLGHAPGMFNADMKAGVLPGRPTTLVHLLVDPYMSGNLRGSGINPGRFRTAAGTTVNIIELAGESPRTALSLLKELLQEQTLTGTFLTIRLGIEHLYECRLDLEDEDLLMDLSVSIAAHYNALFDWYSTAMDRAGFTGLIRPVHPEFYFSIDNENAWKEVEFTRTVMRIDPLLDFWEDSERKSNLFQKVGSEARDAMSWRAFLEKMITLAVENGCVGIKQLQAYRRDLDFEKPEDSQVRFRGELSKDEQAVFQNWVVNECSKLADDLGWPHQVHVGTHNLPKSNPLPLQKLARNYPRQKIVQIHCWPYQREAGYLAKLHSNVYIDTCWQAVLNPEYLRESLGHWLHYVPTHKITMGNDSTSIEMAVGSSLISKTILMETVERQFSAWYAGEKPKLDVVYDFMHNNAVDLYGYGEKHYPA
jgi:predicted TIM-barrel fold metal-dependent hydrolase